MHNFYLLISIIAFLFMACSESSSPQEEEKDILFDCGLTGNGYESDSYFELGDKKYKKNICNETSEPVFTATTFTLTVDNKSGNDSRTLLIQFVGFPNQFTGEGVYSYPSGLNISMIEKIDDQVNVKYSNQAKTGLLMVDVHDIAAGLYQGRFWFSIEDDDYTGAYNISYKSEEYETVITGSGWTPAGFVQGLEYREITPIISSRGGNTPLFYYQSREYDPISNLTLDFKLETSGYTNNDFEKYSDYPLQPFNIDFPTEYDHPTYKSRDGHLYSTYTHVMWGPGNDIYVSSPQTEYFNYVEDNLVIIGDTSWTYHSGSGDLDISAWGEHLVSAWVADRSYIEDGRTHEWETVLSINILNRHTFLDPGYKPVRYDLRNFVKPFYDDWPAHSLNPFVHHLATFVQDIDNIFVVFLDSVGLKAAKHENGVFNKIGTLPMGFENEQDWRLELLTYEDKPVYACFRHEDKQTLRILKIDITGINDLGEFVLPNGPLQEFYKANDISINYDGNHLYFGICDQEFERKPSVFRLENNSLQPFGERGFSSVPSFAMVAITTDDVYALIKMNETSNELAKQEK
ncbi:MAG: hypothetical protein D8M58_20900 [Calditrichaeota bacterium]|nr:MAG: hypothetical protein DWQ03_16615 [Calditrichota bacterium]MBL1207870.1 hypothetical protein [Calditrichota bacterium]NOG47705.1 hypothetical protein [Calditrichota bacterium]